MASALAAAPPAFRKIIAWNISSQWYIIYSTPQTILDHLTGVEAVFYEFEKEAVRGGGKEKPLRITRNAEFQFLSISAPET